MLRAHATRRLTALRILVTVANGSNGALSIAFPT